MKTAHRKLLWKLAGGALALLAAFLAGVFFPRDVRPVRKFLITAYCNCEKCCEWKRDAAGNPVFASGPLKGKPKKIGVTASGVIASRGTAAMVRGAVPFGTLVHIEGAGIFRIEDTGKLHADQIDIWFPTHAEAKKWGRQTRRVTFLD